jgi:ATP-dependent protease HslVU (ClpYQ) peptidase subunit
MATDSATRSVTNTLTTTTADTVTLTQGWELIAVTNLDATDVLYFRMDGTTAVAEADNTYAVLAARTVVVPGTPNSSGQHVISVVGDGGKYQVAGMNSPVTIG